MARRQDKRSFDGNWQLKKNLLGELPGLRLCCQAFFFQTYPVNEGGRLLRKGSILSKSRRKSHIFSAGNPSWGKSTACFKGRLTSWSKGGGDTSAGMRASSRMLGKKAMTGTPFWEIVSERKRSTFCFWRGGSSTCRACGSVNFEEATSLR